MGMAYQGRMFLLGIVLFFSTRSSLIGSEELNGAYFTQVAFHKQEGGSLQTTAVRCVLQCGMRCERVPECLWFNFAVLPTEVGLYECVLLKMIESPENLVPTQDYHHYTRFVKSHMVQPATDSCHNGCCRSKPCQNNGTCVEHPDNPKEKFSCTCSKFFNGTLCENELDPQDLDFTSCLDVLDTYIAAGKMPGNGVYRLRRFDKPSKEIQHFFCAFEGVSKAWTLIESFSLANRHLYVEKGFGENFPRHFNMMKTNWNDYRVSVDTMQSFLGPNSTMFRATCDFPIRDSLTPDFLLGYLSACNIVYKYYRDEFCCTFAQINIRGYEFHNTKAPIYHHQRNHFHIDPSYGRCSFTVPGTMYNEDNFGLYGTVNPNSTCTATQDSTTQWWLGQEK